MRYRVRPVSLPTARSHLTPDRVAVVDLGSNTFRLVVFAVAPERPPRLLDEIRDPVRLSAGVVDGRIRTEAIERAGRTARAYARFCHTVGIEDVHAVATSAIREATNQDEILAAISGPEGLPVRVISTEEEARYGYLGAVNASTLTDGAVLDVGGGSMQLTRVARRRQRDFASFALGAVRATEDYLLDDPPRKRHIKALRRAVRGGLTELDWLELVEGRMLGIGGSIRTLAAMDQRRRDYTLREIQGYRLTREALQELIDEMAALPATQRARLPGLKRDRADILLGGAVVVAEAMDALGFDRIEVCGTGLREGVYYGLAGEGDRQLLQDVRRGTVLGLAEELNADVDHAEQVWQIARTLYERLGALDLQHDDPVEREWLWAAAMLHDVGVLIDYHDHHKHSEYLVLNAGLPGFDHRELAIISALVRGHRKSLPNLGRFQEITRRDDQARVDRLGACLRLAEQLERGRSRSIVDVRAGRADGALHLEIVSDGDAALGTWAASQEQQAIERAFGLGLRITAAA
jgi:exopolyphosphatase/guanosine-5'-triphosphate,3'-diphosphate pyrophosphatase